MDMAKAPFSSTPDTGTPFVRLEVRHGNSKPVSFEITGEEFLIGSVPGCDLRLPGTNLPPVVCLIARQPDGVRLRKLAPTLPVLINGQTVTQSALTPLHQGDLVSIGATDIRIDLFNEVRAEPAPAPVPEPTPPPMRETDIDEENRRQEWARRTRELEDREQALEEDRVLWYKRREELEQELRQAREEAAKFAPDPEELEQLRQDQAEIARQRRELFDERGAWESRKSEFEQLRAEIERRRQELDRTQEELDRSKREFDDRLTALSEDQGGIERLRAELQEQREKAEKERQELREQTEKERQEFREQCEKTQAELAAKAEEAANLRADLICQQTDLIQQRTNLDRQTGEAAEIRAELEQKKAEITQQQSDIANVRKDLYDQFREKRDHLARMQEAVREAHNQLQSRQLQLDDELLRQRHETEAEIYQRRQTFEHEHLKRVEEAQEELRQLEERKQQQIVLQTQTEGELRECVEELQNQADLKEKRIAELNREIEAVRSTVIDEAILRERIEAELRQHFETKQASVEKLASELDTRQAELQRKLDELPNLQAAERGLNEREASMQERENRLQQREQEFEELARRAKEFRPLTEADVLQYQSDLARLDRLRANLEEKSEQMRQRAVELDARWDRFHQEAKELEDQIHLVDARSEAVRSRELTLQERENEFDARDAKLKERTAQIEGQQIMLATLRTRLEQMREEVMHESAELAGLRAKHLHSEDEMQHRLRQIELAREQMAAEKQGYEESSRLFVERSALMHQAVNRMREVQQTLAVDEERMRQRTLELETKSAEIEEQTALLRAKLEQAQQLHNRLEADRAALKEQQDKLLDSDDTRGALQEVLRRRSEEIAARARELDAKAAQLDEQTRLLNEQADALDKLRQDAVTSRQQTEDFSGALAVREEELRQAQRTIIEQQKLLEATRAQFEQAKKDYEERQNLSKSEIEGLRASLSQQANEFVSRMPNLEERAQQALDKTAAAQNQLRQQLAELHHYAEQSRTDLDALRQQVRAESERLREQEAALNRGRSEHRLSVASFKQQLIEWQSRFGDMKQSIARNENKLGEREALVEATSAQLAKQAEVLQAQQREVTEKRTEVEKHLSDMREWYRRKIRELIANKDGRGTESAARSPSESPILSLPNQPAGGATPPKDSRPATILTMADDLDPADRKLGELLRSLELVDSDTIGALWGESRRQRRPLRQVLLSGGYLTLYQLALIESGSLSKLMLGRFHVIDRLVYSTRESIFRVNDPQRDKGTCILRQLGEAEMADPIHPDEYRQRFAAVRDLAHPNLAATLEVLELNNRPAVVQEWLTGLPGGDWPATVAVPGVWFRLVSQIALGLHTAHSSGLIHGRLTADSFLLTPDGTVKILGIGEPAWLQPTAGAKEPTVQDDLRALGQAAMLWSGLAGGKAKKTKGKPFAPELMGVLLKLGADTGAIAEAEVYPSAAALLEELDQIGVELSADSSAWQKLTEHVRANQSDGPLLRQSA